MDLRAIPTKEVEARLRELGIYTRVMRNIRTVGWKRESDNLAKRYYSEASESNRVERFINYAFSWVNSDEGVTFWETIYDMSTLRETTKNDILRYVKQWGVSNR